MNEQQVVCPDELSLKEWEALERGEQLEWWRQKARSLNRDDPLRGLALYHCGMFTKTDAAHHILDRLDRHTINDQVGRITPEILERIRELSNNLPADDDDQGWDEVLFISGGMWSRSTTKSQFEQTHREMNRHTRNQVRLFRDAERRSHGEH